MHINSKVAKRVQRPVKRVDGADEDDLKELLGDEGEVDLTAAPKRRGSAGRRPENPAPKPPHYVPVQLPSLKNLVPTEVALHCDSHLQACLSCDPTDSASPGAVAAQSVDVPAAA